MRGNIESLLIQDIVTSESNNPHSEWYDGVLQDAMSDIERWSNGFSPNDSPVILEGYSEQNNVSNKDENFESALITTIENGLLNNFKSIDKASVALEIGHNDSFFTESSPITATIVLDTSKNIEKEEAAAIVNYILKSVKELKKENIKIVDQNENTIFSGVSK